MLSDSWKSCSITSGNESKLKKVEQILKYRIQDVKRQKDKTAFKSHRKKY
jgi:hypothetical protein